MGISKNTPQRWWGRFASKLETFDLKKFIEQVIELFRFRLNTSGFWAQFGLILTTALSTPITLIGVLFGYIRGYNKFMRPAFEWPRLHNLPAIIRFAMVIGGILIWVLLFILLRTIAALISAGILDAKIMLLYIGINLVLSVPVFLIFRRWRISNMTLIAKKNAHASATTAGEEVRLQYTGARGFYIGGGMTYSEKGHLLLIGGARSGKGENIILANLLGVGGYEHSWVVTDIKGELAAVASRMMKEMGREVYFLNPFDILKEKLHGESSSYNPLDLMDDNSSVHLIDDVALIAELICPVKHDDRNAFFTSCARNIIAALLLHLVVTQTGEQRSLTTLWEWCRKAGPQWDNLLAEMATSEDPVNGRAIRAAANEIAGMMANGETYGSIMANVFEATNFIKSSAIQKSLESGFDPYALADTNMAVFIILPPDKIESNGRWLRLVTTTLMRAIVRKPNKATRTTFLCDEAASLGYISEFEVCLASYAGYGITLWPVYQDLNQINAIYGDKWQTMIANTSVKIALSPRDNFSADYISEMAGDTTNLFYRHDWLGNISDIETNHRKLFTPDEIKRLAKDNMFVFIKDHPVAMVPKFPYYKMPMLKDVNGNNLYDPNPYIENSL